MDSACRNQQGNSDEVENSARPFLLFFSALWLPLCNNSDQTLFSNAVTLPGPSGLVENLGLRPRFSTAPLGPGKR